MKNTIAKALSLVMCLAVTMGTATNTQAQDVPNKPKAATVTFATKSGPISGLESGGIYSYKGIPYAESPIEELQFAPTKPDNNQKLPVFVYIHGGGAAGASRMPSFNGDQSGLSYLTIGRFPGSHPAYCQKLALTNRI